MRLLPLAAIFAMVVAAPALAQGEPTPLQRFLGNIGLLEIPDDPIEYRPRAPLVVPSTDALVPPRDPGDISKINPDWPVDHDQQARRGLSFEERRDASEETHRPRLLTPEEINRGAISRDEQARRAAGRRGPTGGEEHARGEHVYSPDQLGFKGWNAKEEEERTVFTGVPPRRSLLQPPPEYFRPSDKAPYGVVTKARTPYKAKTIYDLAAPDDPAAQQ